MYLLSIDLSYIVHELCFFSDTLYYLPHSRCFLSHFFPHCVAAWSAEYKQ